MTDAAGPPEIMDFTIRREPISFTIDDDTFSAPALLSPITLKRLAPLLDEVQVYVGRGDLDAIAGLIDEVAKLFKILMPGSSGARFAERLMSDPDVEDSPLPIDLMQQALPALFYLIERYGLRPTAPSGESPSSSTEPQTADPSDGTSSTAGVSAEESASQS